MDSREKPSPEAIEGCIARVLQGEREAQASIESAQGRAAAAVAQARGNARAIAERAEARLAAARQSVEARIVRHQAAADARVRDLRATLAPAEADESPLPMPGLGTIPTHPAQRKRRGGGIRWGRILQMAPGLQQTRLYSVFLFM